MNVGDLIEIIAEGGIDVTVGKTYPIILISDSGSFAVRDDRGDENWAIYYKSYIWRESDSLEELRAWKASALARFPALERPETDNEAASRFSDEYYDEGVVTLARGFTEAFAWARANPR